MKTMSYNMVCLYDKSLTDLKVNESKDYDIESKLSYQIDYMPPKVQVFQLIPQGITIYNNLFDSIKGSVQLINVDYTIVAGFITLIIIGNYNFGMFNLTDKLNNTIIGTFSNVIITGNVLTDKTIKISCGLVNGCIINESSSQINNSIGTIISLEFAVTPIIVDPNASITLSYDGQIVLPYKPQIGLFKNDKLIFGTDLPSLKLSNNQLLYIIFSQILGPKTSPPTKYELYDLILLFPFSFNPNIPSAYIINNNSEVILRSKDKLEYSDILSVKLICQDSLKLKLNNSSIELI